MDALDLNTCRAPAVGEQNGYFGIGIYNGKNTQNLGTLWKEGNGTKEHCGTLRNTPDNTRPKSVMKHDTNAVEHHGTSWNIMEHRGTMGVEWEVLTVCFAAGVVVYGQFRVGRWVQVSGGRLE